jgi:predicted PurR-regulated permease PerM
MSGLLERVYNAKWLLFGIALVLLLLWIMRPFLDVFVYAIFVYYITRPIKRRLDRHVKNEALSVAVSLVLLALPLILVISYTLLIGLSQLTAVVQDYGLSAAIPASQLANVTEAFAGIQKNVSSGSIDLLNLSAITEQEWYRTISGYSGALPMLQAIAFAAGSTVIDVLFKLFIIFLISFYLLKEDDKIQRWFCSVFPGLVEEHNGVFAKFFRAVDSDLQKIFFGNLISIVIFAIIAAIAYELLSMFAPVPSLQIPSPILLGILTGGSALIPIIGMWLVAGPLLLYLLASSIIAGTFFANIGYFIFMVLFIFIFVLTLPPFFVQPLISRCNVPMGLLMFAYVFGPLVFGITGLFLGAIVLVLLTNYFTVVVPELTRAGSRNHDVRV